MIEGVDISKYQGSDAMDGYDFAILNVEDPTLRDKVNHAYDIGLRWDIYKWCYPGAGGATLYATARRIVDAMWRPGTRRPQFWLDYEEAGVTPNQIDEWFGGCDAGGEVSGLYCYLYLMNAQGLSFTRDGWLAYYAGNNDGSYYPAMSDEARRRGAKIHQYTSTNGTLDKNVVLDEKWYVTTPTPTPEEDDDMVGYIQNKDVEHGIYAWDGIWKRAVGGDEWTLVNFLNAVAGKPPIKVLPVTDAIWRTIPTAGAMEVGGGGPLKVTLSGTAVPG